MSEESVNFLLYFVPFCTVIAISSIDSIIAGLWNWIEDGDTSRKNYLFRKIFTAYSRKENWQVHSEDIVASTFLVGFLLGLAVLGGYHYPGVLISFLVVLGGLFILRLARRQQKLLKAHMEDKKAHK